MNIKKFPIQGTSFFKNNVLLKVLGISLRAKEILCFKTIQIIMIVI